MIHRLAIPCFFLISFCSVMLHSQQPEDLRRELQTVRSQLDSLKTAREGTVSEESMERLAERLEKRIQQLEAKIDAVSRATGPVIFNPRTTAFMNFAARQDNRTVFDESGIAEIGSRMFLRTIEIDLRAPVDPYAEAIIILAMEDEAGTGFAIDPEEAYGVIKRLPVLETAPMGLKLKVGKFRAPIGQNNRLHMHDLPWITRPLVIAKFFGTEHGDFFESGFNPIGIDLDFFLPTVIPSTTMEMNIDMVRGGEFGLSQGREGGQPALIGHLTVSADWNNEHLIVLGASGYQEKGISNTSLAGVDLLYKWAPSERRDSRSIVVGGEGYVGRHSYQDSTLATIRSAPVGWFAYAQYQLSYSLYAGFRFDKVEEPSNDRLGTTALSAYLSYYTTEFLRFRAGIDKRTSDIAAYNGLVTATFEVNFVFGSHPTEPYWVNR